MTIQEITDLRKSENENKLRLPIRAQNLSQEESKQIFRIVQYMVDLVQQEEYHKGITKNSLLVKSILRRFSSVLWVKGYGTKENPFEIQTKYGGGKFYHAKQCFKNEKYPEGVENKCCFMNCYNLALKFKREDCSILSGIAYKGRRSFLHSVIKLKDKIIDLNYDICIDAELYCRLFNFEVLSELNSLTLAKKYPIIKKHQKFLNEKGFSYMYVNYSLDDLVDYLEDENRNENIEIALE